MIENMPALLKKRGDIFNPVLTNKQSLEKAMEKALGKAKKAGKLNKGRKLLMPSKKGSSARELIDTGRDKRFVRRDEKGQFKESDDVGRSLGKDVQQHAKTKTKKGQGDRGDR